MIGITYDKVPNKLRVAADVVYNSRELHRQGFSAVLRGIQMERVAKSKNIARESQLDTKVIQTTGVWGEESSGKQTFKPQVKKSTIR